MGVDSFFGNGLSGMDLSWALVLIIGFPVATVVLGEIIMRLRRAREAMAAPLVLVRTLVLPALALLVFLQKVIHQDPSETPVRLVQTLFWLFVTNAALSGLNVLLFVGAKEGTWQSRTPKLFIDLVRAIIVLILAAVMLSTVWGLNLGRLIAALGVGSIVLGLALQDPLGNLFSGMVLLFERPLKVGDWIKIGENEGEVVETNWRAVHLQTKGRDLIILPNAMLAKGSFVNFSRPTHVHREVVTLRFSYNDPPNKVKRLIQEVAQQTPGIISDPPPKIYLYSLGESAINYGAEVFLSGYAPRTKVRNDFQSLVWYAARRNGLTMPYPTVTQINTTPEEFEAEERAVLPPSALAAFPRFGLAADDDDLPTFSRQAVQHFAEGEDVVEEGHSLPGIYLVMKGRVSLTVRGPGGRKVEIAKVEPGGFFGERTAIASGVSDTTATALEDLEVLVLGKELLHSLLDKMPPLGREIRSVMEARREARKTSMNCEL